jgi:hypothetical protein
MREKLPMKRWAALLLIASGCGSPPVAETGERIECAVDGAAGFTRSCSMERAPGRNILTIRSPNGSFRRLALTTDGLGVRAADGAEPAMVAIAGKDVIEVSIGRDRYRLPARIR